MNPVYRVIWNAALRVFQAVAENGKARGKGSAGKVARSARRAAIAGSLAGLVSVLGKAGLAQSLPTGGQVVAGSASIASSGKVMTVTQTTPYLTTNWQTFNVGAASAVTFVQPSVSSVAVNRIFDTSGSQILGRLNANGQVYLLNPNGIVFGQGAQVDVGGLVASTLNLSDASPSSATRTFSGSGTGSIVNQGTINAAQGGYVALLGNIVSNSGVINAPLGTVALGAGSAVTLTFQDNSLVKIQLDESVLNNLAANGGLIRADGGQVVLRAGARDTVLASVVNNTGVIQARTVQNHTGRIILLGGMAAGSVDVGGTLDASAPSGGNGGFIETSGAHVRIANAAKLTTAAPMGKTGTWLIDPTDFTIAESGGDISGADLSKALQSNDVSISSAKEEKSENGSGNINVNDAVTWNQNTLTLTATKDININAVMTASGKASLVMATGAGSENEAGGAVNVGMGTGAGGFSGRVDFLQDDGVTPRSGSDFLTINGKNYTVLASTKEFLLAFQGMGRTAEPNKQAFYALGSNIDAETSKEGFTPVGSSESPFVGTFDGLGHTINNLTIQAPDVNDAGLFGVLGSSGIVRNVGLLNVSVAGKGNVGALVGRNDSGSIRNSYAAGTVVGGRAVGGLVGYNQRGSISNSYATGQVFEGQFAGGLVGYNSGGSISNSYATGQVLGGAGGRRFGRVQRRWKRQQQLCHGPVGGRAACWRLGGVQRKRQHQ